MPLSPVVAKDLCVSLQGQCVLHNVELEVRDGEMVGLLGPNGGGKTTLMRALMGLVPLDHGTVRLFGHPPRSRGGRLRTAYVPQHAVDVDALFPATAHEVTLQGRIGRRGLLSRLDAEDRRHARDAMEEMGVWDLRSQRLGRLSGGQRQRVFLAKALAQEPELLLLDEPTAGIDPEARRAFFDRLRHLNRSHGMTLILVTHDPHDLHDQADRFVFLQRGVRFDGTPAEYEERRMGAAHVEAP